MAETKSGEAQLQQQLADSQRDVERLKGRLDAEVGALGQLLKISELLNSTLNLPELLRLIMASAKDLLSAEVCSILLLDEASGDLVFEVSLGAKAEEVVKHRVPIGQGIAGRVAQTGEALNIPSVKDSPYFYGQIDSQVGFQTKNMLALPLKVKEKVIGVVEVINKQGGQAFQEKDLELATALTHLAAVAIHNARLYQTLADALVESRMSYRL
jgi:GAF domain-containing protein